VKRVPAERVGDPIELMTVTWVVMEECTLTVEDYTTFKKNEEDYDIFETENSLRTKQ